jgi:succinate dehydrogenase / fumarate reductase membrane anchor subunit
VPLSLWFVVSMISLIGADYADYQAWIGQFGMALLMILTVLVLFYHAHLGMRVVIEDYVAGERARVLTLLVVEFVLATLAASCVLAVVLVALRS